MQFLDTGELYFQSVILKWQCKSQLNSGIPPENKPLASACTGKPRVVETVCGACVLTTERMSKHGVQTSQLYGLGKYWWWRTKCTDEHRLWTDKTGRSQRSGNYLEVAM